MTDANRAARTLKKNEKQLVIGLLQTTQFIRRTDDDIPSLVACAARLSVNLIEDSIHGCAPRHSPPFHPFLLSRTKHPPTARSRHPPCNLGLFRNRPSHGVRS